MIRDFRAADPVDTRTPGQARADYDNPMAEFRRETDRKWAGKCRMCGALLSGKMVADGNPPHQYRVHEECWRRSVHDMHHRTLGEARRPYPCRDCDGAR